VFDKGNNNESNIEGLLNAKPCPFHFVGGLRLNQCADLLDVPDEKYQPLEGDKFKGATAYRTTRTMYNQETTVIITYNPQLFTAQMEGVSGNIDKCLKKMQELQDALAARAEGRITKGKKPTVDSVTNRISAILSAQHMKDIFDFTVSDEKNGSPEVTYSVNEEKLEAVKGKVLGKSIIFTDHKDWENEKIVSAYRAQYHIEDCFRQMKDTGYLGFRPIHHWTDQMIRVHAFYCVLALTLCSVLNREIEALGFKMTIHAMLDMLQEVQQVITVFPVKGGKHTQKSSFSRLSGAAKEIIDKQGLMKYQVKL
jgi:transposase